MTSKSIHNRDRDKSNEKSIGKRESILENRISRKYKEKFNQSLVSKSKEKRSRISSNSFHNPSKKSTRSGENYDISNIMEEYEIKGRKGNTKKTCTVALKYDSSRPIKARRF